MTVFVDTSAFLAVLDAADAHHPDAAGVWGRVVQAGHSLLSTNYVLVETLSLLHHRFGVTAVRRFQEDILPVVTIAWVDETGHTAGVRAVVAGGRQGPSLVDCVSFDTIARLHITSVFAYDRHFSERGYAL